MKNHKRNPKEDRQHNWISILFELAARLAWGPIHQHVPDVEPGLSFDVRFAINDDSFTFRASHDGWCWASLVAKKGKKYGIGGDLLPEVEYSCKAFGEAWTKRCH